LVRAQEGLKNVMLPFSDKYKEMGRKDPELKDDVIKKEY
jgi:hypothetical protein